MQSSETFLITIPPSLAGSRLDVALAELIPHVSRSKIQEAIKNNQVLLNQKTPKMRDKVIGAETVEITLLIEQESTENLAQEMLLDIVYEDDHVLVINKPAGLVVHPAVGNPSATLLNGILFHHKNAVNLERAGIVHRLDKDTSGIMIVAKTADALQHLSKQLAKRTMGRTYHAIATGSIISGQTIDVPIGRHNKDRKKMSAQAIGKEAVTHIRVLERFRAHTYVECSLETGRTHQIRVHMNFIHHTLFGDSTYGFRLRLPQKMDESHAAVLRAFKRQALHAKRLTFIHPATDEPMTLETELPEDLQTLLATLTQDSAEHDWGY